MSTTYTDHHGHEWHIDGTKAIRADSPLQALAVLERQWRGTEYTNWAHQRFLGTLLDYSAMHRLDTEPQITPAQLKERGFVEPEI